ncbi:MAG: hypothetical protein Q9160_000156 [Pyrenula sp. 1 TL-2023]
MSSGFVPGGTSDQPIERDSDWVKAQQHIEAARRRKEGDGRRDGGKSLYEVLQSNKASKQEAFEESIRLKNQFRALEEDEVEFLDSVLESTRAKEAAVSKETSEQLEAFRKQRQAADAAFLTQSSGGQTEPTTQADTWTTQKKRRRGQVKHSPAAKLRKLSTAETQPVSSEKASAPSKSPKSSPSAAELSDPLQKGTAQTEKGSQPLATNLGLGGYSSEDD